MLMHPKPKLTFRNGGKISDHEKWVYSEQQLEFTNTFRYLSMLFNFNGKFFQTEKRVVKQGNNAHFAISNHLFNIGTMSCFWNICTQYFILCLWILGFPLAIEKVHLNFYKKAILDIFKQSLMSSFTSSRKSFLYQHLIISVSKHILKKHWL